MTICCKGQDSIKWIQKGETLIDQIGKLQQSPDSNLHLATQALTYFQKANNWEKEANCYNHITVYHYYNEDFESAEAASLAAIQLLEKNNGLEKTDYRYAIGNLAAFLSLRGFYEKAIATNERAIKVAKARKDKRISYVTLYQNNAFCYKAFGEYTEAINLYKEALSIRQMLVDSSDLSKESNTSDISNIYVGLGYCYRQKGQLQAAISSYQKAIKNLSHLPTKVEYTQQQYYDSYYNLAAIYLELNQMDSVYFYAQKALKIRDDFNVSEDCYVYQVLGEYYQKKNQAQQAAHYFDQAVQAAIAEASSYKQFPQIAQTILSKANYLSTQGRFEETIQNCQRGLQAIATDFESTSIWDNPALDQCVQKTLALDVVKGKADAFLAWYEQSPDKSNYLKAAYENYGFAVDLVQTIRRSFVTESAKKQLAQKAVGVYEMAIKTAMLLYDQNGDQKYLEDVFAFAESNKAILLLESMNEDMAKQYAGLPDSLLQKDKDLNTTLNFLVNQIAIEKDSLKLQKLDRKFFIANEEQKALVKQLETNYPKYYQLKYKETDRSLTDLQKNLNASITTDAVIEYFVGEQMAYAIVISADQLKVVSIEEVKQLAKAVDVVRKIISEDPNTTQFVEQYKEYVQAANHLYQSILQAPLQLLDPSTQAITIIPDDVLCLLPFEVLLSEKASLEKADYRSQYLAYLVNQYAINYNYSVSFMLHEAERSSRQSTKNFIGFAPLFANALLGDSRNCNEAELANLPCAHQEVAEVGDLLNGDLLLDEAANTAAFQQTQGYKIVHLATHACVDKENPGQNQIYFTDGSLTGLDLYQLDMDADLVVLSACNTGSGQLVKGEGVMSLSRGFIQAGCHSTLMSLWSVNDCTTAELMHAFYEGIQSKQPKDLALQQAKQAYLKTAQDPAAAHPFYWAAFVSFGDNAPIALDQPSNRPFYLAAILLALFLFLWMKFRSN